MKENKFYIYSHTDINGIVRYIGKGTKKKTGNTYVRAFTTKYRSKEWNKSFPTRECLKVNIMENDLDEIEVNKREKYWIDFYKMIKDGGTLVNLVTNISFMTKKEKLAYQYQRDKEGYRRRCYKYLRSKNDNNAKKNKSLYSSEYYRRNRERFKKFSTEYAKKNQEKLKQYYKERYQSIKEVLRNRARLRYELKKKEILEYGKLYRMENRDKMRKYFSDYHNKNKERINMARREKSSLKKLIHQDKRYEYKKKWRIEHPDRIKLANMSYYEKYKERILLKNREYKKEWRQKRINKDHAITKSPAII